MWLGKMLDTRKILKLNLGGNRAQWNCCRFSFRNSRGDTYLKQCNKMHWWCNNWHILKLIHKCKNI